MPDPAGRPALTAARVDDPWCQQFAHLPAEQHLKVVVDRLEALNPGYSQKKVAGWVEPEAVLRFSDRTDFLTDIRPLQCLKDLKTVALTGSAPGLGKLSDLGPLTGLRLYNVELRNNPKLRDLGPLQGMPLHNLDLTNTAVESLADLAGAPLEELAIARTPIRDLAPLRTMRSLTSFDCTGTPIDSLEPLAGTPLKELHLDFRPERDASVLKGLPHLRTINGMAANDFWRKLAGRP